MGAAAPVANVEAKLAASEAKLETRKSKTQRVSLFLDKKQKWADANGIPAVLIGCLTPRDFSAVATQLQGAVNDLRSATGKHRKYQDGVGFSVTLFVVGIGIVLLPVAMAMTRKSEKSAARTLERLQQYLEELNKRPEMAAQRVTWAVRQINNHYDGDGVNQGTQYVIDITRRPQPRGSSTSLTSVASGKLQHATSRASLQSATSICLPGGAADATTMH